MCLSTCHGTDKTKRCALHRMCICICTCYRIDKLGLHRLCMCICIFYRTDKTKR